MKKVMRTKKSTLVKSGGEAQEERHLNGNNNKEGTQHGYT